MTTSIQRVTQALRGARCWILGHDWKCLFRLHWGDDASWYSQGSETSGWCCFRCGEQRTEQWDG